MDKQTIHESVLLQSALNYLNVENEKWYIDATLGGGGHTIEIAKAGGRVIAVDQDIVAIERVKSRLAKEHKEIKARITLVHCNFADIGNQIDKVHKQTELAEAKISGVLFDLGLSSDQLNDPVRGFSFLKKGPLDMRMDQTGKLTAAEIVNTWSEKDLLELFRQAADEPMAGKFAKEIVVRRGKVKFETTEDLANFIASLVKGRAKIHPATRVFQALRIAVNQEFPTLMLGLQAAWKKLKVGGRLVVISFHSGEDRVVKHFFSYQQTMGAKLLTIKPVAPDRKEIFRNPRSRSAKLRAIEKI